MKYSEIIALAEGIAPVIRELLDQQAKEMGERLAAIEQRLDDLSNDQGPAEKRKGKR